MKLTIKSKIIVWFTLFFSVLIAVTIVFLSSVSENIVESEVASKIKDTASDALEHLVVYDNGPFYLEEIEETGEDTFELEPFQYFKDEVVFTIYQNNVLTYGQLPNEIIHVPDIKIQTIQIINTERSRYMIYDSPIDSTHILRSIQNISNSENVVQTIINQLLWFGPILILISALGGYLILKNSFKPVQVLYKTAEEIKNNQDYSKRIPLNKSKDELYYMGDMINQMIHSMETSLKREQAFTSNVSHELRTPIAILKAQLEYLQSKVTTSKYAKDMHDILSQLERIEHIVEQLLMFSKFEHVTMLSYQMVNMSELVHTILEGFEDLIKEKNITISHHIENHLTCEANEISLIRIFNNLISNAIKYNKPNGTIHIQVIKNDKDIVCMVTDTGIGISESSLKKVFDPFYREDASRQSNELNLGIGLSMVKRLIELHKGHISIESKQYQYTKVTFTLPIKNTR